MPFVVSQFYGAKITMIGKQPENSVAMRVQKLVNFEYFFPWLLCENQLIQRTFFLAVESHATPCHLPFHRVLCWRLVDFHTTVRSIVWDCHRVGRQMLQQFVSHSFFKLEQFICP
jgi:hypothetical protein